MRKRAKDLQPGDVIETEWSTRSGVTTWVRTSTVSSISKQDFWPDDVRVSTKGEQPDVFRFRGDTWVLVVDQAPTTIPTTERSS